MKISFQKVAKTVELVKAKGGKVSREPGPVKGGKTVIAFIEDPDGYKFELLERGPTPEPLCQVMLRVGDLDRAIKFYEKVIPMKLFWDVVVCSLTVNVWSDIVSISFIRMHSYPLIMCASFLYRLLEWNFCEQETTQSTR